jgi:hypothetical protein
MGWVRGGYCCRCGDCCKGSPPSGISALVDTHPPAVAGYCPLFEWRDSPEGRGFCIGHIGAVPSGQEDSYYMMGCVLWPGDPDAIKNYPNCTYTFQWVDD